MRFAPGLLKKKFGNARNARFWTLAHRCGNGGRDVVFHALRFGVVSCFLTAALQLGTGSGNDFCLGFSVASPHVAFWEWFLHSR